MPSHTLTKNQQNYLEYIQEYIEEHGPDAWPSYKEFSEKFGHKSPNSVTQNLKALKRKGFVVKNGHGMYALRNHTHEPQGIPILGIITAGYLQEAVDSNLGTISLETLFPNMNRIFALRVSGHSMKGAEIHDGDYVLLVDDDIPNGGIGAVLYNGETSLKRIYTDQGGLRLEPANPEYDNIYIEPDIFEQVTVLGRYVGHVNRTGLHKPGPSSPRRRYDLPRYQYRRHY